MDLLQNYPSDGEDEILFDDKQRQTIACVNPHGDEADESEPHHVAIRDSLTEDSPQKSSHFKKQSISSTKSEDSFLRLMGMLSENESMTTNNGTGDELDNTVEVVEYIQKQGPHTQADAKEDTDENRATPCKDANIKTPIFKTPVNTMLPKQPSPSNYKKTPCKNLQYQHIASPVASYIKNSPQVPLVQEIRPKKPLPGPSSNIPKFVSGNSQTSSSNKDYVNLPSLAYKSAKKTKVVNMPSAGKLPKCQWAKKIVSSLPRPVVIKHDHRELNMPKEHPHQEDSFADLSLHQADVSVCTQKSAFCKPQN